MAKITRNPERDITPQFLSTVFGWLGKSGEVLVVMRYLCGGGSKDFAIVKTEREFEKLVEVCPEGTDIIVFRDKHLPFHGVVDEAFIEEAMRFIPDGAEYMLLETKPAKEEDPRCNGEFDYKINLKEDLKEAHGANVAIGICPDFMGPDSEEMISASKGGIDGPR